MAEVDTSTWVAMRLKGAVADVGIDVASVCVVCMVLDLDYKHRGALRGTPGSACPQPEPNATKLPSCAPISARAAQRRRQWRWWRGEEGARRPGREDQVLRHVLWHVRRRRWCWWWWWWRRRRRCCWWWWCWWWWCVDDHFRAILNFKRTNCHYAVVAKDTHTHTHIQTGAVGNAIPFCMCICPCPFFEVTSPGAAPGPPVKTGARVRRFRGCNDKAVSTNQLQHWRKGHCTAQAGETTPPALVLRRQDHSLPPLRHVAARRRPDHPRGPC